MIHLPDVLAHRSAKTVFTLAAMVLAGSARAQDTSWPAAPDPAQAPSVQAPSVQAGSDQGPAPTTAAAANPAAAPALRAFCTDRPTKSNGACILDQGSWQIEGDVINITHAHADGGGSDTYLFTNPTLKYGLTHDIDLEVNWAPYEAIHTYGRNAGGGQVAYGVGDLYLRAKIGVIGQDGGSVAVTLLPYVKAPTAPATIGNRAVEEGLIIPIVIKLTDKLSVTFDPELDVYKDAVGDGRHLNTQQLASLSYSLPENVTVYAEFWSDVNFDPTGASTQYSTDLAAAWGLPHDLQLDAGVNIGLNRETPAVQGYFGVSHRF